LAMSGDLFADVYSGGSRPEEHPALAWLDAASPSGTPRGLSSLSAALRAAPAAGLAAGQRAAPQAALGGGLRGAGAGAAASLGATRRAAGGDEERFIAGALGDGDLDALLGGHGQWKNISEVLRRALAGLARAGAAQASELTALRAELSAIKTAQADVAPRSELSAVAGRVEARAEAAVRAARRCEETMDLKADAAFVTECLLTKVNRSEAAAGAAAQTEARARAQAALEARLEDAMGRAQAGLEGMHSRVLASEARVEALAGSIGELAPLRAALAGSDVAGVRAEALARREAERQSGELGKQLAAIEERVAKCAAEAVAAKEMLGQRQVNDLVRQVERLAAVQAGTQALALQLEERLTHAAPLEDLERVRADKANKLSVAQAVHRKANKADVEVSLEALDRRLKAAERRLRLGAGGLVSAPQSRHQPRFEGDTGDEAASAGASRGSRGGSVGGRSGRSANSAVSTTGSAKVGVSRGLAQLRERLRETQDALLELPDREQVAAAMDRLAESARRDTDALRLELERIKAQGPPSGAAVEGRVRAAAEAGQQALARTEQLGLRVTILERDVAQLAAAQPHGADSGSSSTTSREDAAWGPSQQELPQQQSRAPAFFPTGAPLGPPCGASPSEPADSAREQTQGKGRASKAAVTTTTTTARNSKAVAGVEGAVKSNLAKSDSAKASAAKSAKKQRSQKSALEPTVSATRRASLKERLEARLTK
jgi:hypothetical protein